MYGRVIAAFLSLLLCGFLAIAACPRAGAATLASTVVVAGNRHVDAEMIRSHFQPGLTASSTPARAMRR